MSVTNAGATVAYVLTYTIASQSTATVATVLGQVLDNGQTNYIPSGTSEAAIYLNTASASGESTISVDGTTYYYKTGAAVPDLVTGITASANATASSTATQQTSIRSGGVSIATLTGTNTDTGTASASSATSTSTSGAERSVGVGRMLVIGLCFSAIGMLVSA